jgi:hypothetical protein
MQVSRREARWTVALRQKLSEDVAKLPQTCLNDIVMIVMKRQPESGDEVTLDFDAMPEATCDNLMAFVLKSCAEGEARATLESCAKGDPSCPWIKKTEALAPLSEEPPEARRVPPPSQTPPGYLLYAAVTVAAVAAVVVMRRRA